MLSSPRPMPSLRRDDRSLSTSSVLSLDPAASPHGRNASLAAQAPARPGVQRPPFRSRRTLVALVVPMGRSQVFHEHACAGAILIVVRKTPGSLGAINTRLNSRPRPGGLLPRFEGAFKDFHPLAEK